MNMPLLLCNYVFIVVFALFIPAFNQQYATSTGTEVPTSDRFHEQQVFAAFQLKHMESAKEKIEAYRIESLNEMKGDRIALAAEMRADRIALAAEMRADRIALAAEMRADRISLVANVIAEIKSYRKAVVDESKNIVDKMDARFKEVAEERMADHTSLLAKMDSSFKELAAARKANRIASAEEMDSLNFKILILIGFKMVCTGTLLAGVFATMRMIGDGLKKLGNEK
jgi:hypothetical protein